MYNYVYRVLQEFFKEHPPCKVNFHTSGSYSSSGKLEKHPKSNVFFKPRKVQKKKRFVSTRKRTAFFLYNIVWNRLVNPFIEIFVPGVKKVDQLSKLNDFRTHDGGFSPKAENSNKLGEKFYSRCLEEPRPLDVKKKSEVEDLVIKGPTNVLENKAVSETDAKKIWENKNKCKNDLKKASVLSELQSTKTSALYNILIKRFVDAKIENLMPKDCQISQICDFRSNEENLNLDYMQYEENTFAHEGKVSVSLNPYVGQQLKDTNVNKKEIKTSKDLNLGKTNLHATQAKSIPKPFPGPANAQMRPVSEVNLGKPNNKLAESIKINKKLETMNVTAKPPSGPKVQAKVKPFSKINPPSTTVPDKVNVKENVIKRLHIINGKIKPEQGAKENQIKTVTTDVYKPSQANKFNVAKTNSTKTQFGKRFENDLIAKNTSESNKKIDTYSEKSKNNNILPGDQSKDKENDSDEVLVQQENFKSKDAAASVKQNNKIGDENDAMLSTNLSKFDSEIITESVREGNDFSKISDDSNSKETINTSDNSTGANPLESNINEELIERTKIYLDNVNDTIDKRVDEIKLENKRKPINPTDVKDFGNNNTKSKGSTNVNPSVQLKNVTNQTGSKIDLELNLAKNEQVSDKINKSCLTDSDEKLTIGLKTHLVSFNEKEGCIVKHEQNLDNTKGDLIDLSTVVLNENKRKRKTQNKENSNRRKETLQKVNLTNQNHLDENLMKPWKKGKEDLDKIKGKNSILENNVSSPLSSINDAENKVTKGSSLSPPVDQHFELETVSDSGTGVNKEPALEGVKQQNNQEITINTVSNSHRAASLNSKSSANHTNQNPQPREKSVELQKSTQKNEKSMKTKSDEGNNHKSKNLLKNKSEEKVTVLREIKKEKSIELKRNDPVKEKQTDVKENKTEITNIKTESKPTIIKDKTKLTLNNVAEKNKTLNQEEIKNKNSSNTVLVSKSENLVSGRISNDNLKQAVTDSAPKTADNISVKQSPVRNSNKKDEVNSQLRTRSQEIRKDSQNNVQNNNVFVNRSVEKISGSSNDNPNKNLNVKESKFKESSPKTYNDLEKKHENKISTKKSHKTENMKDKLKIQSSDDNKPNNGKPSFTQPKANPDKLIMTGNIKNHKGSSDSASNTLLKKVSIKMEPEDVKILPKIDSSNAVPELAGEEEFKIKMNQLLKSFTVTEQNHTMNINKTKNQGVSVKKEKTLKENTNNMKNKLIPKQNKQANSNQNNNKISNPNTKKGETVRPTPKMAQNQIKLKKGNEKTVEDQTATRLKNIARVVPFSKDLKNKGNSTKNIEIGNSDLANKVQTSSRVKHIDVNAHTEKSNAPKNNPRNNLLNKNITKK